MGKNKCIKCGEKNEGSLFSTDVQFQNEWYRLEDLDTRCFLLRKFEIFAFICNSCLEKSIKIRKSSELTSGIIFSIFALFFLSIFLLKMSIITPGTVWIMILLIVGSLLGAFFSLRRYYKLPFEVKNRKEAEIMIEGRKNDIIKDRDQNRLCDICGNKGHYKVSIYDCSEMELDIFNRSLSNLFDIAARKILSFYRCNQHPPTEKEFSDIRKQSLSFDVTRI